MKSALPVTLILAIITVFFSTKYQLLAQDKSGSGVIDVGIVVTDLERSLDFYTNILGMIKYRTFTVKEDFAQSSGLSNGQPFEVTVLKLKDDPEATEWKLMTFNNTIYKPKNTFISEGKGLQYVTFFVDAIEPILDRINKNNIILLGDTPTDLENGNSFVLIQDPDGVFIELIGPMN